MPFNKLQSPGDSAVLKTYDPGRLLTLADGLTRHVEKMKAAAIGRGRPLVPPVGAEAVAAAMVQGQQDERLGAEALTNQYSATVIEATGRFGAQDEVLAAAALANEKRKG